MMQVPTTFDYAAFISELTVLVDQAKSFGAADRCHGSALFRNWRHEVEDLIARVNRKKYDVNCNLGARLFRVASYGSVSAKQQSERFERDLQDTLSELDLVISRYMKYGDPMADMRPAMKLVVQKTINDAQGALPAPLPDPLKVPEKVTLPWILHNVPVRMLWWALITAFFLIGGAFSLGIAAAGTKAGRAVLEMFTPSEYPAAAPPSKAASK